jgi:hypothetical protein
VSQADWDRLQYHSRKVKSFKFKFRDTDNPQIHPLTYFRIGQLQSSALFPSLRHLHYNLGDTATSTAIFLFLSPLLDSLELFNIRGFEDTIVGSFLTTLSSPMLSRIVLSAGRMSVDILKKSLVHFKLELSDAVFMSDFTLWEVLGALPALADLTLKAIDPASHPAHATENSNNQSGGLKYFVALESLCVTGSLFFIQHLLGLIDSPCLTTIKVYPVINVLNDELDNYFTPSLTRIVSKWSQSLKNLVIDSSSNDTLPRNLNGMSKCLMLLTVLHEMQTFRLINWRMEHMDDDVRRLVMSWPKLRTLRLPLNQTFISLSTLRIIAENCPELRQLHIRLDTSTIPPFDTSSKSLRHNLEVLSVGRAPSEPSTPSLECQIQMTQHLDLIFPFLKSIEVRPKDVTWSGIRDLVRLCQDAGLRRVNLK